MLENPVFESENTLKNALPEDDAAISRRTLLAFGALGAVVLALPALPARADFAHNDVQRLRFLEEIARVEADFFAKATISVPAEGLNENEMSVFATLAKQDSELARWFIAARSRYGLRAYDGFYEPNMSSSRPLPSYQFGADSFKTRENLYSTAISIKETAVGGFHGAVGESTSPDLIQAFAALAGVQGRHLALLREMAGRDPLVAYEDALSSTAVALKFESYGFNREVLG